MSTTKKYVIVQRQPSFTQKVSLCLLIWVQRVQPCIDYTKQLIADGKAFWVKCSRRGLQLHYLHSWHKVHWYNQSKIQWNSVTISLEAKRWSTVGLQTLKASPSTAVQIVGISRCPMPNKAPGWHQWNYSNLGSNTSEELCKTPTRRNICTRHQQMQSLQDRGCKVLTISSSLILKLHIPSQRICKCVVGHRKVVFLDSLLWVQSCGTSSFINPTSSRGLQSPSFYPIASHCPDFPVEWLYSFSVARSIVEATETSDETDWCEASKRIKAHQSTKLLGFVCWKTHQSN